LYSDRVYYIVSPTEQLIRAKVTGDMTTSLENTICTTSCTVPYLAVLTNSSDNLEKSMDRSHFLVTIHLGKGAKAESRFGSLCISIIGFANLDTKPREESQMESISRHRTPWHKGQSRGRSTIQSTPGKTENNFGL
jgi:hypothetical protein